MSTKTTINQERLARLATLKLVSGNGAAEQGKACVVTESRKASEGANDEGEVGCISSPTDAARLRFRASPLPRGSEEGITSHDATAALIAEAGR